MGTVHGVYLKYVGISAMSYAGYSLLSNSSNGDDGIVQSNGVQSLPALYLGYSAVLNGMIACLFKMEWGMSIIGKSMEVRGCCTLLCSDFAFQERIRVQGGFPYGAMSFLRHFTCRFVLGRKMDLAGLSRAHSPLLDLIAKSYHPLHTLTYSVWEAQGQGRENWWC